MTKQQPSLQKSTQDLGGLADPIDRIATMLADVSTELGHLSEQLRIQRSGIEAAERSGPDAQPTGEDPRQTSRVEMTGEPGLVAGEPVDTSFSAPTQTPAATAAGAFPSHRPLRWVSWSDRKVRIVGWVGMGLILFGILLLLVIFSRF